MKPLQAVVLRLFSLLALVAGVVMLGLAVPITQVESAWAQTIEQLPGDWRLLGFLFGGLLLVFGLFGLLPLGIRRGKSVAFAGEHGQIIIQLDPVERKLNKVLNKMPEIRKIRAVVVPDKEGGPAHIRARAWLRRLPDQRARDIELRVADYIEETATDFLGLEAQTPVELVVEDIEINIDDAAKELQRHSQERAEEKELSQALTDTGSESAASSPTIGQAAGTAAAAALAHQTFADVDTDDAESDEEVSSLDEAEGYVGVPASLSLEDAGIYSPEIPGTATSEYVIGTSGGEVYADRDVTDSEEMDAATDDAGAPESEDTDDEMPQEDVPSVEPGDIEPPEQDAMQVEYTLTTPGEPEDDSPDAPVKPVTMADYHTVLPDEAVDEEETLLGMETPRMDDALEQPIESFDTPLPPLEEVGPEEDTPYAYGIATDSDEEDDELQGLPPLGELTSEDDDAPEDDPPSKDEHEKRWRF